ncbi:MAG: hypothetical protein IJ160_09460 [Muribaculaceae bacterium]|nr:hypothetical protein [Muribaculaceae bacterium]
MKKSLLLLASVLTCMTMWAQADYFEFVDKDGNVVPNEATLTLTDVTTDEDPFTGEVTNTMYSHLKVRNKDGAEHAMRINMLIERMDNGAYQLCFPWTCKSYPTETNVVTDGEMLAAGEMRDLQTEWIPADEGGCDVTLTVEVLNMTGSILNPTYTYVCDGPTVTLHYRNGIVDEVEGDIDGNGSVGVEDVNAVINVMLGKAENALADVNGNGSVGVEDVNAVINIMLGK